MCFSAPVSFITSAALTAAGAASIPLAKTRGRKMIAAVPFLFAIQQFTEGLQWLVAKPSAASDILAYVFLIFAFLLWPIYVPLAVLVNERRKNRQKIIRIFLYLGIILTLFMLSAMLYYPIQAVESGARIRYDVNTLNNSLWAGWYVLVVVGSFLAASDKRIRIFGLMVAVSAAVSMIFFNWAFTSVWCFFAAVLSLFMYVYLRLTAKKTL